MRLTLICVAGLGWTDWREADGWQATPLLWPLELSTAAAAATLATGTLPERHGIVGDDEGWALGTRPVSRASWRIEPFWQVLATAGLQTASLDWPGSSPGSAWSGLHVDERFAAPTGHNFDNWAVPPGALPATLDDLRDLRVHPADLAGEQLLPIVPALAGIDQARTHSVELAARALARAATVQAAALAMAESDNDFFALHFALPAELCVIGDSRVDPAAGRAFVRAAVERLRAASPHRVIVLAGHGTSGEAGVLATHGIDLGNDPRATSLASRLCAVLGVDYAAVETPAPLESMDPRSRGYALPPAPPAPWQASRLALLARMVLPRAPATSRTLVEQALAIQPDSVAALRVKALCEAAAEAADPLTATGEALERLAPGTIWGPLARALADAYSGDKPAAIARLTALDAGTDEQGWSVIGAAWLVIGEGRRAAAAFAKAPSRTDALLGTAQAAILARDFRRAETLLHRALAGHPVNQAAHLLLAELYAEMGRSHEAADARRRAEALTVV
jgi:hypothetical protein